MSSNRTAGRLAMRHTLALLHALPASEEQKMYMMAKVHNEAVKALVAADTAKLTVPPPTREEVRRLCAETDRDRALDHPYYHARFAIEDRHNPNEAARLLLEAENILVEWAAENCRRHYGDRYAAIAEAFRIWPNIYGDNRQKLIDICAMMPVAPEVKAHA